MPVTIVFVNDSGPNLAVRPQPRTPAGAKMDPEAPTPGLVPQPETRSADDGGTMVLEETQAADPMPPRTRRATTRPPPSARRARLARLRRPS